MTMGEEANLGLLQQKIGQKNGRSSQQFVGFIFILLETGKVFDLVSDGDAYSGGLAMSSPLSKRFFKVAALITPICPSP